MHGRVFNIQRFSTHDGPGIRTTVFLKGCPLHCAWCHNPESQRAEPQLFFMPSLCIDCEACSQVCPLGNARETLMGNTDSPAQCLDCHRCAQVCPAGAIDLIGRTQSVEDVLYEVLKDRVFYEESGGGLTLSGGEPLFQARFTHALLKAAKEAGLNTCLETCGLAPWDSLQALVPYVDLFLWDVKDTDPLRHHQYTGAGTQEITRNLHQLDQAGAPTLLRAIIIPELNMDRDHLDHLVQLFLKLKHCRGVELLAYHPLGNSKKDKRPGARQEPQTFSVPDKEVMQATRHYLCEHGLPATLG